jgi:hypothetical protein
MKQDCLSAEQAGLSLTGCIFALFEKTVFFVFARFQIK